MECPNCNLKKLEFMTDASRGMGNQTFHKCPFCGTVVLCSGDKVSQSWTPEDVPERGKYAARPIR